MVLRKIRLGVLLYSSRKLQIEGCSRERVPSWTRGQMTHLWRTPVAKSFHERRLPLLASKGVFRHVSCAASRIFWYTVSSCFLWTCSRRPASQLRICLKKRKTKKIVLLRNTRSINRDRRRLWMNEKGPKSCTSSVGLEPATPPYEAVTQSIPPPRVTHRELYTTNVCSMFSFISWNFFVLCLVHVISYSA